MVTSNRATVTIFVATCDLNFWVIACRVTAIEYTLPSSVLIAQAVFLLQRKQTDATEHPTDAGGYAGVGNKDEHSV